MTVMMVDHFTWSMEVGTTEIAHLVDGTQWVVGDRANFEFRIIGDYECFASFADDADGGSGGGGGGVVPSPVVPPTAPTAPPNSGGGGGGSTDSCSVSSNWGAMTISPYWGSSTSLMFAMISNAPSTISSFSIRGADQSDSEYQRCVLQNVNFFQCTISGGALMEPASVLLNDGAYSGLNIIESMTGSNAEYPLSSCNAAAFTADDGGQGAESGVSRSGMIAIVFCGLLLCFALAAVVAVWRWKRSGAKKTVPRTDRPEEAEDAKMVVEVEVAGNRTTTRD